MILTDKGSLYTGVTNDLPRRLQKHCQGQGAKFFRSSHPMFLMYVEEGFERGEALKREYAVKSLSRTQKIALIEASDFEPIEIIEN